MLIVVLLVIGVLLRYCPKIDLVLSKNETIVLFWYNKYNWDNTCERRFVELFRF